MFKDVVCHLTVLKASKGRTNYHLKGSQLQGMLGNLKSHLRLWHETHPPKKIHLEQNFIFKGKEI